jgi:hypothetical protein
LALRFEQEASALQEKSEQHRAAAVSYEAMSYAGMQRGSALYRNMMMEHCRRLVDNYRAGAEDNRALSNLHREMATQIRP